MMSLYTFLYYTLFCSTILIYGIGLNQTFGIGSSDLGSITMIIKVLISIYASAVLSYLVTAFILVKLSLVELYPLISLLIFLLINTFLESIIRITTGQSSSEFILSWLIIVLSVNDSTSLVNTIIIATSCFVSLLLVTFFVYAFKKRLYIGTKISGKQYSLIMMFLAVLIISITVFDVGWLNSGAIK